MMYEPYFRPQQMGGPGYSYSPEPQDIGGVGGGGLFRQRPGNGGVVPPHMRTGGGGQMMNYPSPFVPPGPSPQVGAMQTGGTLPPQQFGQHMQTGGLGQMSHFGTGMRLGGGMQQFQFPQQGLFQAMRGY